MAEYLPVNSIPNFSENLKKQGKKLVLVGGCFDILHPGHIAFLEKAKKAGDVLIVILESDAKVRDLKGFKRPILGQKERAKVLSALRAVDYIVLLPYLKKDEEYDRLIGELKPDVIAATAKDTSNIHYQRTAKLVGAKLKFVVKMIGNYSTSRILDRKMV